MNSTHTPTTRPGWPLVGLVGNATAGKDATGRILTDGYGYTRVAFCDGIGAVARGLGWNGSKADGGREFLMEVGGAVRGALGEEAFVIPALRRIHELLAGDVPVVVTDVRMRTEYEAIKRCGGVIVRVIRPGVGVYNDNPTEVSLIGHEPDLVIHNDGDLESLRQRVDELLSAKPLKGRATKPCDAALLARDHLVELAFGAGPR